MRDSRTTDSMRTAATRVSIAAFVALWLVAAVWLAPRCAPAQEPAPPVPKELGEVGWIGTEVRQVRAPNGRLLVIRGQWHNPYDEPVDGIRFVVQLLAAGDTPRVLDRIEQDLDRRIPPGRTMAFDRDVPTPYAYVLSSIAVLAFAKHRGTAEFPPPSREIEDRTRQSRAVFFFTGDMPIVTSLVPSHF